ncbi:ATP-binding protein [Reyranella soli]|uniref:histidine kinase n=1 Tax=Reyranella soli TaxID=1230389 RepID=A0A512NLU4_9HYPH|nr:ATP-binding protein [Reyranella soli]GEP59902.1 hypothetical protein RSO01_70680 [Reyranella soli]
MSDLISTSLGPQIQLVFDVQPNMPPAKIDPQQVEMAILNLSVNARDAMTKGGVLKVSALCETVHPGGHPSKLPPGRYISLSFADTGSGMDEATMAQATEPFFSTKTAGKGTGLGLSTVDGLASQLGGALVLSSSPGQGTVATLMFPVSSETPVVAASEVASKAEAPALGRILLVDDEALVRSSTAAMLIDLGYEVVEAESAEEALNRFDRDPLIDGVMTDNLMSGLTGLDLADAVRGKRRGIPVLLMSGLVDENAQKSGLLQLAKPFRQAQLASSVAALLRTSQDS